MFLMSIRSWRPLRGAVLRKEGTRSLPRAVCRTHGVPTLCELKGLAWGRWDRGLADSEVSGPRWIHLEASGTGCGHR